MDYNWKMNGTNRQYENNPKKFQYQIPSPTTKKYHINEGTEKKYK